MHQKFRGENAHLIGALVAKKLELRSLWTDPKSDPEAIVVKEKELRDLQNQMREKVIRVMLEARKILTSEQLAKVGSAWAMGHGEGIGFGWQKDY